MKNLVKIKKIVQKKKNKNKKQKKPCMKVVPYYHLLNEFVSNLPNCPN